VFDLLDRFEVEADYVVAKVRLGQHLDALVDRRFSMYQISPEIS
jgi:hypothetical protein